MKHPYNQKKNWTNSVIESLTHHLPDIHHHQGEVLSDVASDVPVMMDLTGEVGESSNGDILATYLANGNDVVLFNVKKPEQLVTAVGFGLVAEAVVLKQYDGFLSIHALGANIEEGEKKDRRLAKDGAGCSCWDMDEFDNDHAKGKRFSQLSACDKARMIEAILEVDIPVSYHLDAMERLAGNSNSLPLSQFKLIYLTLEQQWSMTDAQLTNNSVVFEISLYASYNPQYKYLRVQSLGAGFNPGGLESNSTYDRGYFQSGMNINITPQTDKVTTLSTEPKNVNKQTQYTAGSSFTVGVDISKNPSFSPSYTVSNSQTVQMSDFNVYNNSAGRIADWDFKLAMMENSVWDMFKHPFMKKGQVKELPALATRNLQTLTDTVWFSNNNVMDTIGLDISWNVDHYRLSVTGDWTNYTEHYSHKWKTVGTMFYVDFAAVTA